MSKKQNTKQRVTTKDVIIIGVVLVVVFGIIILAVAPEIQWTMPVWEQTPDFTITFTGPTGTNVSFDNNAIGYFNLGNESTALIRIKFQAFCYTSNGSWFELAEYDESQEVWSSTPMHESENKTFTTEAQVEMLESLTFAIWYCESGKMSHGVTLKFILESYKGNVRVRPV